MKFKHFTLVEQVVPVVPERTATLAIVTENDKTYLAEVNDTGEIVSQGRLFEIKPDGTFLTCVYVAPSLGYPLDEQRRVIVKQEI